MADVAHAIITPECRDNRGAVEAWGEAVRRCRAEYDAIVAGWSDAPEQPTLHLILSMERPKLVCEAPEDVDPEDSDEFFGPVPL